MLNMGRAKTIAAHIGDKDALQVGVEKAFGRVDILVYNAAMNLILAHRDCPDDATDRVMECREINTG